MDAREEFHHEPLLVVGSCLAGRVFRAHDDGVLTGLVYRQPWDPGDNHAICPYVGHKGGPPPKTPKGWRNSSGWSDSFHGHHGHMKTMPHRPGGIGCSCGFWMMHDLTMAGEWARLSAGRDVIALVQARGTMTRGTKGYRAEIARIVAIVEPDWSGFGPSIDPNSAHGEWWDLVQARYPVPTYADLDTAVASTKGLAA